MKRILVLIVVITHAALAHDYIPAPPQPKPVLLKGGDLYTITDGVLSNTDLLFDKGVIVKIEKNSIPDDDTLVMDVSGKCVFPGLIAPLSTIGLTEIGADRASNDLSEVGLLHPEVQAHIAFNADSELIPSVRANGFTSALIVPQGGLLSGRSSLMQLDGWSWEDSLIKSNIGLHINWPQETIASGWWVEKSPEDQKKEIETNLRLMDQFFSKAYAYFLAKKENPSLPMDIRWEAVAPVFTGAMPVFITADHILQIRHALQFAYKFNLKIILVGGNDAWMCIEELKAQNIPLILGRVHELPAREDEDYDLPLRLPALLAQAGLKVCFSCDTTSWGIRNITFEAGQAVAFGFPKEQAYRALTLTPAELFGVSDTLGSLSVGKQATLIVSNGDILDPLTNHIEHVFISGRKVDLQNRHTELYNKYREKLRRAAGK